MTDNITIELSAEVVDLAERLAAQLDLPVNELINFCLEGWTNLICPADLTRS